MRQAIRLGHISVGGRGGPVLARLTRAPAELNALLAKPDLLHLFGAPGKWAGDPANAPV